MIEKIAVFYKKYEAILKLEQQYQNAIRQNPFYNEVKEILEKLQPKLVFCSHQRGLKAATIFAVARDLGIRTTTVIFSWDNLPKATTLIEPDFYFVWSDYMKKELLQYCPYVKPEQVLVTGTPQFESHFDTSLLQSKEDFYKSHHLDLEKKYICFSGDDIVTSPLDQYYLEDLAISVRELNQQGYNLGIIYRKCPVDFTNRYDAVLQQYQDVIVSIDPLWRPVGTSWNEIMPTKEDFALQSNICEHTEFVGNIASSMVFDFVAHDKSCLFFDYEQPQLQKGIRDIGQNYKYIHFRSMPNKEAALFVYDKKELTAIVKAILDGKQSNVPVGKKWFDVVVGTEPTKASEKIWEGINSIVKK